MQTDLLLDVFGLKPVLCQLTIITQALLQIVDPTLFVDDSGLDIEDAPNTYGVHLKIHLD